jgi:Lon protease-like protein
MNDDATALSEFTGVARLFPLPGLVFFPHAVQPLHIFEPRYRDMTADALAGDRLIALVLLRPGWEDDYDDRPAVQPVACLGRVIADHLLPDGRYNLVLRGLARVRILDELDGRSFRLARTEILHDTGSDDLDERMALRTALADLMLPRVTAGPAREQLRGLFQGELPLGPLCDILAFALPLPAEAKQDLLATLDVGDRARRLMEAFRVAVEQTPPAGAVDRRFPPDFSVN